MVEMVETVACPCCGYKTFKNVPNGCYYICEVCFWEDDPIQRKDPDNKTGANPMSLRQARRNFIEFGACEKVMVSKVRPPEKDEQRDKNWKPIDVK